MKYENVWAAKFGDAMSLTDDELRGRISVDAVPCLGIHDHMPATAAETLKLALKKVHVVTEQELDIIRKMAGRAHAYAHLRYNSLTAFLGGIYSKTLDVEPWVAMPITGIAGVGKTDIVRAFDRLFPPAEPIKLQDGTIVPHYPSVRVSARDAATLSTQRERVSLLLGSPSSDAGSSRLSPDLLRKRVFNAGCCHLSADEFQFVTQSSSANTLATKLLMALTYFGPPVAYVTNFSLFNLLLARRHEEHERLLSDPNFILPEQIDSPALIGMLTEWKVAADGAFGFDPTSSAEKFDAFTGGSKRSMVSLAVSTYGRKRELSPKSSAVVVSMDDIEEMYKSQSFAVQREDAKILLRLRIHASPADRKRTDLYCPLQAVDVPRKGNAHALAAVSEERSVAVNTAALRGSLTPVQAKKLDAVTDVFKRDLSSERALVPGKKLVPKRTLEGMMAHIKGP